VLPFILLTVSATAALVISEWNERRNGIWIAKPLASLGFVFVAVSGGALQSLYGRCILAALVLCLVGDLLLISRSKAVFLAGLGSFLFGHIAFTVAFVLRGRSLAFGSIAALVLVPFAAVVWKWLSPHLSRSMQRPVGLYVAAILGMVVSAAASFGAHADWRILAGAVAFTVSDLSVARDRFIERSRLNRLWGLPLYYGAQLLLASSVG